MLKIYDTLAPQGDYPAAFGKDISVVTSTSAAHDMTGISQTALRQSFHLGNVISLNGHSSYRINSLAVRATAGTVVHFDLYAAEDGALRRIAELGSVTADGDNLAALTIEGGYEVNRGNTIILASAASAAIHCYGNASGMTLVDVVQYADGDYTAGADIPYSAAETSAADAIACSLFRLELDYLDQMRLDAYLQASGKVLAEVAQKAENALPAVSAADNGKFLCVVGDVWAAVAVDNAEGVSF